MYMDTILLAEEPWFRLTPFFSMEFITMVVRKGRRFGFPKKQESDDRLQLVMDYFNYSKEKAEAALLLLTDEQLQLLKTTDTGGR